MNAPRPSTQKTIAGMITTYVTNIMMITTATTPRRNRKVTTRRTPIATAPRRSRTLGTTHTPNNAPSPQHVSVFRVTIAPTFLTDRARRRRFLHVSISFPASLNRACFTISYNLLLHHVDLRLLARFLSYRTCGAQFYLGFAFTFSQRNQYGVPALA